MVDNGQQKTPRQPDVKSFTLVRLGSIEGVMDTILTGEEAVWVRLAEGVRPEDIVGLEVFARRPA